MVRTSPALIFNLFLNGTNKSSQFYEKKTIKKHAFVEKCNVAVVFQTRSGIRARVCVSNECHGSDAR